VAKDDLAVAFHVLHLCGILAGDNPKIIVLDLVQPLAARRQFIGLGRKARRDEAGGQVTRAR
jgi:hypothetical protein